MESKALLCVLLAAAICAISQVNSATFYSTHGNKAPSIAAQAPQSLLRTRLRTRQTANTAQQPQTYSYQQLQDQAAYNPSSNLVYYPAQNTNPLASAQIRGQNPAAFQQIQQFPQFLQQQQPQQVYQQQPQQLFQPQQVQQAQPEAQYQQQLQQEPAQPYAGGPIPGGVRYIFTPATRQAPARLTAVQRQPQVVEEPSPADSPAPAQNVGQLGVSYSPATAVSSIKFSNPYANYSYG